MKLKTFATIVRWILTVVIMVNVYRETGAFTTFSLVMLTIASEIHSYSFGRITAAINGVGAMLRDWRNGNG